MKAAESSSIFLEEKRKKETLAGDFVSCLLEYPIITIQGEFRLIAEKKLDPRTFWVSSN